MTSVVQSKLSELNAVIGGNVVLDSTPIQGNLLIAILTWTASTGAVTYPWGATPDLNTGNGALGLAIMSKIAGASESASVSFSAATNRSYTLTVVEVAPTVGRQWVGFDQGANSSSGGATSLTIGPAAALAEADDISVAGLSAAGTVGASQTFATPAYTNVVGTDSSTRGFTGYRVLGTTAAPQTTAAWTTSRAVAGALATYKQQNAPAPPSQNSGFLALL